MAESHAAEGETLFGEGSIQIADVVLSEILDALPQVALGCGAKNLGRGQRDTGVVNRSEQKSTAPRALVGPVQLQPNWHQPSSVTDRRKVVDDRFCWAGLAVTERAPRHLRQPGWFAQI